MSQPSHRLLGGVVEYPVVSQAQGLQLVEVGKKLGDAWRSKTFFWEFNLQDSKILESGELLQRFWGEAGAVQAQDLQLAAEGERFDSLLSTTTLEYCVQSNALRWNSSILIGWLKPLDDS